MSRKKRLKLIRAIEESRNSKVIAYVTGDRQGVPAQIGFDAVLPMYRHVRPLGFAGTPKIDLFLYSEGGAVDVPWRLVTMLREYCQELNVLIPYKAHSAATLISLGADQIVMGKKGELGPIDPIITGTENGRQETMSVEDVMAFVNFLKERAGLGDQAALAGSIGFLINRLSPWTLGAIYRTHSHIRLIARNLLTSHKEPIEERQINLIVQTLAEKIYSHGHAIGRREAKEIGLPIKEPDEGLENNMWELLEAYEDVMKLSQPIDPANIIPRGEDEYEESIIMASIESITRLDVFEGILKFRHIRQEPPQLNLTITVQVPLPPEVVQNLPDEVNTRMREISEQLQGQIASFVESEVKKQSPIQGVDGNFSNACWKETTNKGI